MVCKHGDNIHRLQSDCSPTAQHRCESRRAVEEGEWHFAPECSCQHAGQSKHHFSTAGGEQTLASITGEVPHLPIFSQSSQNLAQSQFLLLISTCNMLDSRLLSFQACYLAKRLSGLKQLDYR